MATDRMITGSVAIFYLHNCQTRDFIRLIYQIIIRFGYKTVQFT